MRIKIAEKLKPFSHEPGTVCLLPGSHLRLQLFPSLLCVEDMSLHPTKAVTEISLSIAGPIKNFTVQLDLVKGCIWVWGQTREGYIRYRIVGVEEPDALLALVVEKQPKQLRWSCTHELQLHSLDDKTTVVAFKDYQLAKPLFYTPESKEVLSFGCHKAQDWRLIKRRHELTEILPFWHRLGNHFNASTKTIQGGTITLLDECERLIEEREKKGLYETWSYLFSAGFEGMLSPRLEDRDHQGFSLPPLKLTREGSALFLLTKGAELIKKQLIQFQGETVSFLPVLLPEFHCGRFLNIPVEGVGIFTMEWSKKLLKKMVFLSQTNQSVHFHFQKDLKRCRMKENQKDRGKQVSLPLSFTPAVGKTYFFDRFEK